MLIEEYKHCFMHYFGVKTLSETPCSPPLIQPGDGARLVQGGGEHDDPEHDRPRRGRCGEPAVGRIAVRSRVAQSDMKSTVSLCQKMSKAGYSQFVVWNDHKL